jgi:hypothetical protein
MSEGSFEAQYDRVKDRSFVVDNVEEIKVAPVRGLFMILLVLALSTSRSGRYVQLCYAESGKGDESITSTELGLL